MKFNETEIQYLGHDGFLITTSTNKKIAIDPYNISDKIPKVDIILITHGHQDHCSIADIKKIAQKETIIIVPADAQSKINKIPEVEMQVVVPGEEFSVMKTKIETIPAYNVGKTFHNKSDAFVGYVIKDKDTIIYHAGDTDKIPEMEKLTGYGKHNNTFVALLPVSGKVVMNADEAADAAKMLSPTVAIPMHFGSVIGTLSDAERFVKLCKKNNIHAEILEKI